MHGTRWTLARLTLWVWAAQGAAAGSELAAAILTAAVAGALASRRRRPWCLALTALALACTWQGRATWTLAEALEVAARRDLTDNPQVWSVRAIRPPALDDRARSWVELVGVVTPSGRVQRLDRRVTAAVSGVAIPMGAITWLRGRLELTPAVSNPGAFDRRRHLFRRYRQLGRLRLTGVGGPETLPHRGRLDARRLSEVPARVAARLAAALEARERAPAAALARAMLLGDTTGLEIDERQRLRRVGWAHLVAVSGMHVGFVLALFHGLGRVFRRPAHRHGALVGAVWLYAAVCGGTPSVVRAATMATALLAARALGRPLSGGRALAVALLATGALSPESAADLGAQLSFAAVAGLVVLVPGRTFSTRSRRRWWVAAWGASAAAQLGTLPVVAAQLHAWSPLGLLTAPVAIPWAGAVVVSALVALGLAVCTGTTVAIDGALSVAAGFLRVGRHLDSRGGVVWGLAPPPATWLAAYVLTLAAAAAAVRTHVRWRVPVLACLMLEIGVLVLPIGQSSRSPARVRLECLDVGQGDALLVAAFSEPTVWVKLRLAPERPLYACLIDAGDRSPHHDHGAQTVLPRLRQLGITRLDHLVITHADRDHWGGAPTIIARCRVDQLVVGVRSQLPRAIAQELDARAVAAGDTLYAAPAVTLTVRHPSARTDLDQNNRSVVLELEAFGWRALMTGDLEAAGEARLLERGLAPVDILKVAHHGSATSSTAAFLAATQPALALVSAGRTNRFGHPAPAVIERLLGIGAAVYRTDQDGAVQVELSPTRCWTTAGRGRSERRFRKPAR